MTSVHEPRRYVGFELDSQIYGLPILQVQEVLASADIEPVPGAPPHLLGVINLRGAILTVMDLRRCLGLPDASGAQPAQIMILDHGQEPFALRVDRVSAVRSFTETDIRPAPRTGARDELAVITGIAGGPGTLMLLMDVERLLNLPK
ncbi:MAG: chemotaxis protein CheW [Panacagrimonas sp.]